MILRFKVFLLFSFLMLQQSCKCCSSDCGGGDKCIIEYTPVEEGKFSFYLETVPFGDCTTGGECGRKQIFVNRSTTQQLKINYTVVARNTLTNEESNHITKELTLNSGNRENVICERRCDSNVIYIVKINSLGVQNNCF